MGGNAKSRGRESVIQAESPETHAAQDDLFSTSYPNAESEYSVGCKYSSPPLSHGCTPSAGWLVGQSLTRGPERVIAPMTSACLNRIEWNRRVVR